MFFFFGVDVFDLGYNSYCLCDLRFFMVEVVLNFVNEESLELQGSIQLQENFLFFIFCLGRSFVEWRLRCGFGFREFFYLRLFEIFLREDKLFNIQKSLVQFVFLCMVDSQLSVEQKGRFIFLVCFGFDL